MVIITEVATGAKFTGKDLCQSLFAEVCKFIKKETLTQNTFDGCFYISQYTRKINRIWNVTLNIYLPETRLLKSLKYRKTDIR